MSRSRAAFRSLTITLLLAALAPLPRPAAAQMLDPNSWISNGDVNAVAIHGNTIFLGGNFTAIGPPTGALVPLDPATAVYAPGFPRVVGQVYAMVSDGAGGVYLGGGFTSVGGQARTNLAHVNASNVVTSWAPVPNQIIFALHRGSSGTVYIGGLFTTMNGLGRTRLAEVDAAGNLTAYAPSVSSAVRAIQQSGTNLIIGGDFTSAGGQTRNRIAMISTSTGLATAWNPSSSGTVRTMKTVTHIVSGQPVTNLFVGGSFTTIGGQARNNAAALSLTTGLANAWNPNLNSSVTSIAALQNDFVLGGHFTSVGGQACTYIALVNATSGANASWFPALDAAVHALSIRGNQIVVGGAFTTAVGQPRRGIASIGMYDGGILSAWNPRLDGDVFALYDDGTRILTGGGFSSANTVARNYLAAIDRATNSALPWNPNPNAAVNALALRKNGPNLFSVFAGGAFTQMNGTQRLRLAELDPTTGAFTSWNPGAGSDPVYCLKIDGDSMYVGGAFTGIGGVYRPGLARVGLTTGQTSWSFAPMIFGGPVLSVEAGNGFVYAGGSFTTVNETAIPRSGLAQFQETNGVVTAWNPSPNGATRAMSLSGSTLYLGGDFVLLASNNRLRIGALNTTIPATTTPWNPSADSNVRSMARSGNVVYAGGDFLNIGLVNLRSRLAAIDATTGAPTGWNPGITGGTVFAIAVDGTEIAAGGAFTAVGALPQAKFARFDPSTAPSCINGPLTSPAGTAPRAIATGDFDNDGVLDLVVCTAGVSPEVSLLRGGGMPGAGDGSFVTIGALPLAQPPTQAVTADFDLDGLVDLAIAQSGTSGLVTVLRNGSETPSEPIEVPLFGHCEGLAVGDVDQDGILDLVACLTDSAGVANRGGVQLLRGGGANGVWNGTFATAWKLPAHTGAVAKRVALQDMNGDGTLDIAYSGVAPGSVSIIRMQPGGVAGVQDGVGGLVLPAPSGFAFALGDVNGDGRADQLVSGQRALFTRTRTATNNTNDPLDQWFAFHPQILLPSTPRQVALFDHDLDGVLDAACTFDSLGLVQIYRGLGNGDLDPLAIATYAMDAWGLAVGDFAANGSTDLLVGQPSCGTVTVLPQTGTSPLPLGLAVVAPNGGEIWAPLPPVIEEVAAVQTITWTKGAGIPSVDVQLSRDNGQTWRTIGANQPGTSLTWISTPPGTGSARVRVVDAQVAARLDASDGSFQVAGTPVAVDPLDGLPRVAAIRLLGANPVRGGGALTFRLDVPRAADVQVDVYDVLGRHVQSVASGRLGAGTHELVWNGEPSGGARAGGPRAGVYFARALVGEAKTVSKFVVLP